MQTAEGLSDPADASARGADPILRRLLVAGAICNDAAREGDGEHGFRGNPTDVAFLDAAEAAGLDTAALGEAYPRVATLPFGSAHKYMGVAAEGPEACHLIVKGAPEIVLGHCTQELGEAGARPIDTAFWEDALARLAADGRRVIAIAEKPFAGDAIGHEDVQDLTLIGLAGFIDPPREEVRAAVRRVREAGVTISMVTGDHPVTAGAIAEALDLGAARAVIGRDIEAADDVALRAMVSAPAVYARATPVEKLKLVEAAQAAGAVVAMTGDGVNDAAALKRADIGVAMGRNGTEAAKEAAGIVLADDNFATIGHAIEEGRVIYDNLRKAIVYILPTSLAEGLAVMAAVFAGTMLPITPLQILWINLVTETTLSASLAFERAEKDVMQRPPRGRQARLVGPFLAWRVLFVSAVMTAGVFFVFDAELAAGASVEAARTAVVNFLVAAEILYLINCRRLHSPSLTPDALFGNRAVLIAIAAVLVLQMGFTYFPPLAHLFQAEPLGWESWARIWIAAAVLFVAVEAEKLAAIGVRRAFNLKAPA